MVKRFHFILFLFLQLFFVFSFLAILPNFNIADAQACKDRKTEQTCGGNLGCKWDGRICSEKSCIERNSTACLTETACESHKENGFSCYFSRGKCIPPSMNEQDVPAPPVCKPNEPPPPPKTFLQPCRTDTLSSCVDPDSPTESNKYICKPTSPGSTDGRCDYPSAKTPGSDCNSADPNSCNTDLVCKPSTNSNTGTCVEKGTAGAPCNFVELTGCRAGLICQDSGPGTPLTCGVEKGTKGSSCRSTDPTPCKDGLICSGTGPGTPETCVDIGSGAACDPKIPGTCAEGLECNSTDGKNYKCGAPENAPPPAPGPCSVQLPKDGKCPSFFTALGILSTDPAGFIRSLFGILLAMSGAIAILLIIRAGYKIMTSEGKPEALQEGKERLISAIVGLLFLIFALVFLQVIGFDILRIPGIGGVGSVPAGGQCDAGSNNSCAPGLICESQGGTKGGICVDKSSPPQDPPTPITYASCRDVLRLGSSGRCVRSIQQILSLDPADGNYDQRTEDAVRKYQGENGLFPDGDVGPCTLGKMGRYSVDPICSGPLNDAILRQFQTEKGLVVDGRFGACTWEALIGQPIPDNCKRK